MEKKSATTTVNVIETEVYSRVVGYYRPVQNWNKGKRKEFSQRNLLSTPKDKCVLSEVKHSNDICI